jgi:class 3 adenylate cyclase
VDLASRLQGEHQETLTAREIEAIAVEVGLDPAFIRQALAQLSVEQTQAALEKARKRKFWSLVATFAFPFLWGTLALLGQSPHWKTFFTLVTPLPLAVLLGLFSGQKKIGFWSAVTLILVLSVTIFPFTFLYAPFAPLVGLLGKWGAALREEHFPVPSTPPGEMRPSLLKLLFALQSQLESHKQHRAFLSVDVVGSSEMKRGAPELAVEHSFTQFRLWVEEVVRAQDGQVHSAAGDGVMGMFAEDAAAVQAAQQLQQGLLQFNASHNRLPRPFRIRCGVSAGEVAVEEGVPIGHLQSPVIDRAAMLQKRAEPGEIVVSEEVAAALPEFGSVVRLTEPVEEETALTEQPVNVRRDL